MKRRRKFAIGMACALIGVGCSKSRTGVSEQEHLHADFLAHFEQVLKATESQGQQYIETLQHYQPQQGHCSADSLHSVASSIYLPKSAQRGNQVNCLMKFTQVLDRPWAAFHRDSGYVSWVYLYDNNTKSLRIYPATDPQVLFGDDLTFESFSFFKGAMAAYPKGAWSNIREDINGTGKILIYSQAIRFPGEKDAAVIGIDIQTNQILKQFQEKILAYADRVRSPHMFLMSYYHRDDSRLVAHEFSTNPRQWMVIKTADDIRVMQGHAKGTTLTALEKRVQHPLQPVTQKIQFHGEPFLCTFGRLNLLNIYSLLCVGL